MPPSKTVNFDTELGMLVTEKMPTKKIHLLGRDWTIICDLNSFAMAQIAGGDAGGLAQFVANLFPEEDRDDFVKALAGAKGLTGEKLGALLAKLIEVAGERPTEPLSPSPTTGKRRTSTLKSVAN